MFLSDQIFRFEILKRTVSQKEFPERGQNIWLKRYNIHYFCYLDINRFVLIAFHDKICIYIKKFKSHYWINIHNLFFFNIYFHFLFLLPHYSLKSDLSYLFLSQLHFILFLLFLLNRACLFHLTSQDLNAIHEL